MEKAIIVDIDGTLANIDHRLKFIQGKKKDWKAFHDPELVAKDKVNEWCKAIMNWADINGVWILLVTGRPNSLEKVTREWLYGVRVRFDELCMRASNDFRPDFVVKKELYEKCIKRKYDVLFVLEDRAQVVEMWRGLGLVTLQCAGGNY